jgi:hypothetical protein
MTTYNHSDHLNEAQMPVRTRLRIASLYVRDHPPNVSLATMAGIRLFRMSEALARRGYELGIVLNRRERPQTMSHGFDNNLAKSPGTIVLFSPGLHEQAIWGEKVVVGNQAKYLSDEFPGAKVYQYSLEDLDPDRGDDLATSEGALLRNVIPTADGRAQFTSCTTAS